MSNKSSQEKREVKTPAEIVQDMEREAETKRQRQFVKEKLFPFLRENTKNRSDAKMVLKSLLIGLQQAFQNEMGVYQKKLSESPVSTLEMEKYIQKGEEAERFTKLLELFQYEKISVTSALLDGMENTISGLEREESTKVNIDSLEKVLLD